MMPFMICEEERVKSFEEPTAKEQKEFLSKSKKHVIYSGILCCKAGVYLQELKTWAPEVYQVAKNAWEARVAQYVAIDTNLKMPRATIEQVLLTVSDKIKVVIDATEKLQVPTENNDEKPINSKHS
jgi:mannose-1-phosphate guanylyltransferase